MKVLYRSLVFYIESLCPDRYIGKAFGLRVSSGVNAMRDFLSGIVAAQHANTTTKAVKVRNPVLSIAAGIGIAFLISAAFFALAMLTS